MIICNVESLQIVILFFMNKLNKIGLIISFVCIGCLQIGAKEYEHAVQGYIVDNMTGTGLDSTRVTLMKSDSTVIATSMTIPKIDDQLVGMYRFQIQKVGKYIIKAERKGYDDGYMDFELRSNRETFISVKTIRMTKVSLLPPAIVKATKVKMVMNGDTIVYNADAFNLAEGSMLDALVSRLPGAQLTKNGEIFVNSKKIESLLINGRDFFSGNPKVALQNLPAYTVSKIKVYDEAGVASRIMQRDMGDKRYVMDVNLKKEYSNTYIGNAEAGGGTDERYLARAFGMKMSDNEWVMGSGSINNLNDNQKIGYDYGNNGFGWTPQETIDGRMINREAVFSYTRFFDRQNKLGGDITLNHTNGNNESRMNTQTYLPEGDSFLKQHSHSTSKSTLFKGYFYHNFEKDRVSNLSDFSLQYIRNTNFSHSGQTTSDTTAVLNEMLAQGFYKNQNVVANGTISGGTKIIVDMLRWNLCANYNRFSIDQFSLNDIQYTNGQKPRDFRNTYLDNSHQHWNIKASTKYDIYWPGWTIAPEYEYNYRYSKASNILYRLDKIVGRDSTIWDILPSTRDALIDVLDSPNSYDFHEYQNIHRFSARIMSEPQMANRNYRGIFQRGSLQLPLRIAHNNLFYNRLGRHDVRRYAVFFEPNIFATGFISGLKWTLEARMWSEIPDMTMLISYRDDTNPLNIRFGNPDLRNQHNYSTSLHLSRSLSSYQQSYWLRFDYNQQDNAVAYANEFDKNTGISTIRPVSVNGNWNSSTSLGYSRALDKAAKFNIDNQLRYNYYHSVDMVSVSGSMPSTMRSIVNNHLLGENLKLTYRLNDNYEFTLYGGTTCYFVRSHRKGFENINAVDYQVGFNTTLKLPANFQFTSNLTMHARRGYQQSEMNTTNWVWNAQLTRSFLKGKLLAKLKGYDILQQLSNTHYMMNAQGRTESWHNGIPRYMMLSISWRFNAMRKQK